MHLIDTLMRAFMILIAVPTLSLFVREIKGVLEVLNERDLYGDH